MLNKRVCALAVVAALAAGASKLAVAQSGETPPALDGAKTISALEAKAMLSTGALVLDARKKTAYSEGHIPGAQSVGAAYDKQAGTFDVSVFGPDKAKPLIIHGHGSDGWTAVYAVKAAVGAGYSNVSWLRGGWAEWEAAKLPTE